MIPLSKPLPSGLLTRDDLAPLGSSPGRWVQKAVLYPVLVQATMSEQHWYQEILPSTKSFPINTIPFELSSFCLMIPETFAQQAKLLPFKAACSHPSLPTVKQIGEKNFPLLCVHKQIVFLQIIPLFSMKGIPPPPPAFTLQKRAAGMFVTLQQDAALQVKWLPGPCPCSPSKGVEHRADHPHSKVTNPQLCLFSSREAPSSELMQ